MSKSNLNPVSSFEGSDRFNSAVAHIEGLCGQVFCEDFFIHMSNFDVMAVACEKHPKVLTWWHTTLSLGHPHAPAVWAEIKARMDSRAASRIIEGIF
jgi:hypothetical protein